MSAACAKNHPVPVVLGYIAVPAETHKIGVRRSQSLIAQTKESFTELVVGSYDPSYGKHRDIPLHAMGFANHQNTPPPPVASPFPLPVKSASPSPNHALLSDENFQGYFSAEHSDDDLEESIDKAFNSPESSPPSVMRSRDWSVPFAGNPFQNGRETLVYGGKLSTKQRCSRRNDSPAVKMNRGRLGELEIMRSSSAIDANVFEPTATAFTVYSTPSCDSTRPLIRIHSPASKSDPSLPIEGLSPRVTMKVDWITNAATGLAQYEPELSEEGIGGTYFLKNAGGYRVAVFKPSDEEPLSVNNPKRLQANVSDRSSIALKGVPIGEGCLREVAASLLDHGLFAGVPDTRLATVRDSHQIRCGSLQKYIHDVDCSSWDIGPKKFSTDQIHRIGILDLRLYNCDRHGGNILVTLSGDLVPIDHAYCIPSDQHLDDLSWFEWLNWPQSKLHFAEAILEYIKTINITHDAALLRSLGLSEDSIRTMKASSICLKIGAKKGLNLYQIGSMFVPPKPGFPSKFSLCYKAAFERATSQCGGKQKAKLMPDRFDKLLFKHLSSLFEDKKSI